MFYKVHTSNKNSDYSAVISKLIETCDTISFPCDVSVFTKCFFFPWRRFLHNATVVLPGRHSVSLSCVTSHIPSALPHPQSPASGVSDVTAWEWAKHDIFIYVCKTTTGVCGAHLVLSLFIYSGTVVRMMILLIDWRLLSLHDSAPCSGTNRSPPAFRISRGHKTHAILRQHFHTSACHFWKLYLTFNLTFQSLKTAEWSAEDESQTRSQTVH